MKPMLNFEDGYVTIELSPFQCASLAKACHFASEKSFDPDIDNWRTLASLFHACTVVGLTQWQMSKSELEAVLKELENLNFGQDDGLMSSDDGLMPDDNSKHNNRRNGHQH